jgi:hypothetical protein
MIPPGHGVIEDDRAMATRTFDIAASVGVAPVEAIDFLLCLDRHVGLHPYFTRADIIAEGSDDAGRGPNGRSPKRRDLAPSRIRCGS